MTENEATPDSPTPKPAAGLVDLSDLRLMPAWVAGIGATTTTNLSKYEEREDRGPRRDGDRGDRRGAPPRRDGGGGGYGGGGAGGGGQGRGAPRRDGPGGGFGGGGPRRDGPPGQGGGGGGPRRDGDRGGGGSGPRRFGDRDRDAGRPQREWVEMPRDIQVSIEPEDKSAEALASHIRSSGHAFSMFDAARLVLAEGDRFHARFTCDPARPTGLFVTPADGGLFLTRDEATQHILRGPALETYYRSEDIELEEPKGEFKSVGVCGLSSEIIAPPSHHSFQTTIIRLHRERFSNMSLEDYKRRVRVETDPELVAKWKEKLRKGTRWVYARETLAEGQEPTTLATRAEMEAHFRRLHGEDAVREQREVIVLGSIDKQKMTHVLFLLLRNAVEGARKHLFEMSQKLGGGFERRGLKLFKRRAGKLFVCRVKPRAVDQGVILSARVSRVVDLLRGKAGIILHELVETISPSAAPLVLAEGAVPVKVQLTDEQISVIKDVRWLANEGYVIEYSDGMIFLGVQGEPQAPKGSEKPAAAKPGTEAPAAAAAAPVEAAAAAEADAPAEEQAAEIEAEAAPEAQPEAQVETAIVTDAEPELESEAEAESVSEAAVAETTPEPEAAASPPQADVLPEEADTQLLEIHPPTAESPAEVEPAAEAEETAPAAAVPLVEAPAAEDPALIIEDKPVIIEESVVLPAEPAEAAAPAEEPAAAEAAPAEEGAPVPAEDDEPKAPQPQAIV